MNLQTLAKLALAGLIYVYLVKLLDTLYHGVFPAPALVLTVVSLNLLAGIAHLLFFIALRVNLPAARQSSLTGAAYLAIAGSGIALLPKLLALARLLPIPGQGPLLAHGSRISAFCPWLSAVLLMAFSLAFCFSEVSRRSNGLRLAFAMGAGGWLVMAASLTPVVINYLGGGGYQWMAHLFAYGPLVFVVTSSLVLCGVGYFYLAFARGQLLHNQQDSLHAT